MDHLQSQSQRFGRPRGFPLARTPRAAHAAQAEIDLEGRPGVLGRADRFVETAAALRPPGAAAARAGTWIVEKLSHALDLARSAGAGLSFVTLAGRIAGGRRHADRRAAAGRRRPDLAAQPAPRLEGRSWASWRARSHQGRGRRWPASSSRSPARQQRRAAAAEHRQALDAVGEQRLKISAAEERRAQFDQQRTMLEGEFRAAEEQHETAVGRLAEARQQRPQIEPALAEMEGRLAGLDEQIDALEAQRQARNRETTETKVELAKSEERLRNLHCAAAADRGRPPGARPGHRRRPRAIGRLPPPRRDLAAGTSCGRNRKSPSSTSARSRSPARPSSTSTSAKLLQQQRAELTAEAQQLRGKVRKIEERLHAQDLAANQVRIERNALVATAPRGLRHRPGRGRRRGRRSAAAAPARGGAGGDRRAAAQDRRHRQRQPRSPRRTRYPGGPLPDPFRPAPGPGRRQGRAGKDHRQDQHRQPAAVCRNAANRRGHFQQLFRDLFGGGHGDIVLEEGVDILESGMEIVARPPGKEPRSISLLSGGEKTLTCVALLLAIFRSRPSPFCVLDEVDAALDEANIDRFTKVLHDFLAWTQFIIVTHSKKTMTCADTIYGVTMQESGVSKQVSVRFEDVQRGRADSARAARGRRLPVAGGLSGQEIPPPCPSPRGWRLHFRRCTDKMN